MLKSVLTIATGTKVYLDMAAALARSFRLWNDPAEIGFVLVTDQVDQIPHDLDWISVIEIRPGQYGRGFSPKLYLNEMSLSDRTLFVDADCLCTGRLDPVFDRFAGKSVSVIGRAISEGEWFGDVGRICNSFGVLAIPRFNGGVYYFERGRTADAVFRKAQELQNRYDEIGFVRLRESPNDEVLMALSMALHEQQPIPDDGTIMNSTLAAPGGVEVDVLAGKSIFKNPRDHPQHNGWYEMEEMYPVLAHFLGYQTAQYPYRREAIRLEKIMRDGWSPALAKAWATARFSAPWLARREIKSLLRPLYRLVFGVRAVQRGSRSR